MGTSAAAAGAAGAAVVGSTGCCSAASTAGNPTTAGTGSVTSWSLSCVSWQEEKRLEIMKNKNNFKF